MREKTFRDELRQSLDELAAIDRGELEAALEFEFELPDARKIRERMHMSRDEFAALLGVSTRTLENWEQGRRRPTGAALRLLEVAEERPEALLASQHARRAYARRVGT